MSDLRNIYELSKLLDQMIYTWDQPELTKAFAQQIASFCILQGWIKPSDYNYQVNPIPEKQHADHLT